MVHGQEIDLWIHDCKKELEENAKANQTPNQNSDEKETIKCDFKDVDTNHLNFKRLHVFKKCAKVCE